MVVKLELFVYYFILFYFWWIREMINIFSNIFILLIFSIFLFSIESMNIFSFFLLFMNYMVLCNTKSPSIDKAHIHNVLSYFLGSKSFFTQSVTTKKMLDKNYFLYDACDSIIFKRSSFLYNGKTWLKHLF